MMNSRLRIVVSFSSLPRAASIAIARMMPAMALRMKRTPSKPPTPSKTRNR